MPAHARSMTLARFAADTPAGIVLVDVLEDVLEISPLSVMVEFSAFAQVTAVRGEASFRFVLSREQEDPTDPEPEPVVAFAVCGIGAGSPLDTVTLTVDFRVAAEKLSNGWYHVYLDRGAAPVTATRIRVEKTDE